MKNLRDNRSIEQIAKEVFFEFQLNQSITVYGYEPCTDETLDIKGMAVVEMLEKLDSIHNFTSDGKKMRRKRFKPKNSVGAYVAHKIFKYKQDTVDGIPRVQIWRFQ